MRLLVRQAMPTLALMSMVVVLDRWSTKVLLHNRGRDLSSVRGVAAVSRLVTKVIISITCLDASMVNFMGCPYKTYTPCVLLPPYVLLPSRSESTRGSALFRASDL